MTQIKNDLSASEAVKVDQLCGRVLSDIGSIHARITPLSDDEKALPMSPELVALRRHIREISDAVRDLYPAAFYR
jgi:hypothetical protein